MDFYVDFKHHLACNLLQECMAGETLLPDALLFASVDITYFDLSLLSSWLHRLEINVSVGWALNTNS